MKSESPTMSKICKDSARYQQDVLDTSDNPKKDVSLDEDEEAL